ncbi:MAG: thioesterase family protein [Pseudomonadota bacterium]
MTGWTETYRGIVKAWECDVFDHFTIAFYFDRLSDCSAATTAALGATAWQTESLVVRYRQELRAGDGLHAESALLAASPGELKLAHRFFNSVTGAVTTLAEQTLRPAGGAPPIAASAAPLEGWEPVEPMPTEQPGALVDTGRDLVKPIDIDAAGGLSWAAYVHRFSGCGPHLLSRIGMTPSYMREAKQGFSTFETRLNLLGPRPKAGDLLALRSGILRMGKSSIGVLHRMVDLRSGDTIASLHQSGVQLDMVARRSNPWPEAIRRAGEAILGG